MPLIGFLLDADAVIHLHSLGLIGPICEAASAAVIELHCTRYVWQQELASLDRIRDQLIRAGLQVHTLDGSSAAGVLFKRMLLERGSSRRQSKGEYELVAFAVNADFPLALVARDEGARRLAKSCGISAMDLASFLCELICLAALEESVARELLEPWDNPHAGNGRPKDYPGFDAMLARWRSARP